MAACNTGGPSQARFASVTVGTDIARSALLGGELAPFGVPTDPTTGNTGVTEAELTVTRGGNQVYFDAAGNEVATEAESTPIFLTVAASTKVLNLLHGTYSFVVVARDDVPNVLANGSELNVSVTDDIDLRIQLVSVIDTASLTGPVAVVPNQIFDVFLFVHPPGRSDLNVPTSDYEAGWSHTGGSSPGSSDLGIRISAACEEVSITASVYDAGMNNIEAQAFLTVPVAYTCPTVEGSISVDIVPPFVEFAAPLDGATVDDDDWVTLAGNVADAQSGVAMIEIYDGPVLIGWTSTFEDPVDPNPYATWSIDSWWPDLVRTYTLTVVATDNAGNQSQDTITLTRTE
ncbi:MAG: hypothetical protein KF813_12120 [Trueperaceae bacterium]|nr:hypothetical protein [Trueperaceae bacterium]